MKLPKWMRGTMLATSVMNVVGAITFLPVASELRQMGGLPNDGHPLYMVTVGAFVLIFGLAYLWAGISGVADRLFVGVAAAGKLTFFGLLTEYWALGALPARAPLAGIGDLIFGVLFLVWLYSTRWSGRSDEIPRRSSAGTPPN